VSFRVPAHYIYPQAFVQPSMMMSHVQSSAATATAAGATSPYLDYTGAAYAQYSAAAAAAYEQYPYAASPAPTSYMTTAGYGYAVQQPLAAAATPGAAAAAFSQYQPQQLQTDRMQWNHENYRKGGKQRERGPKVIEEKILGAEWWLSQVFYFAVLLPKSLKKISNNMERREGLLYILFKWDQYFVTVERVRIFNMYSAGKYWMLTEVNSLNHCWIL